MSPGFTLFFLILVAWFGWRKAGKVQQQHSLIESAPHYVFYISMTSIAFFAMGFVLPQLQRSQSGSNRGDYTFWILAGLSFAILWFYRGVGTYFQENGVDVRLLPRLISWVRKAETDWESGEFIVANDRHAQAGKVKIGDDGELLTPFSSGSSSRRKISGSGRNVTDVHHLTRGRYRFDYEFLGEQGTEVELIDIRDIETKPERILWGHGSGSTIVTIRQDSDYVFQVQSFDMNASWSMTYELLT